MRSGDGQRCLCSLDLRCYYCVTLMLDMKLEMMLCAPNTRHGATEFYICYARFQSPLQFCWLICLFFTVSGALWLVWAMGGGRVKRHMSSLCQGAVHVFLKSMLAGLGNQCF